MTQVMKQVRLTRNQGKAKVSKLYSETLVGVRINRALYHQLDLIGIDTTI